MSGDAPRDAERWARVNELFHRALDEPADRRESFVRAASDGDTALAHEVLSLLAAHARAESFIERPAVAASEGRAVGHAPRPIEIGHYRILDVIGEGGMGIVYLAEDRRLGRQVALKAVPPRFSGDGARRDRLRREARAAATLNHPGIATIYALEEIDGHLYLTSEYVPGQTLRDALAQGPMPPARAARTMASVARAVAAAHARGIVHRDLKPENVIRAPSDEVKILDFGLARFHDMPESLAGLTADGAAIGTPGYMSPEQIRGGAVDARSDIFAMGVMLHELLTGRAPFAGADPAATIAKILETEPPPLPGTLDSVHRPELQAIVDNALSKSPDERIQSADAFAAALERIAATAAGTPAPHGTWPLPAPRAAAHHLWWWQFHQVATSAAYILLLWPMWHVRDAAAGPRGTLLFLAALTAVVVAVALRMHLLFAAKHYHMEWRAQHARSERWILAADMAFVLALLSEGLLVQSAEPRAAALLVASASAVAVSFVVIEPATTRVTFGEHGSRTRSGPR